MSNWRMQLSRYTRFLLLTSQLAALAGAGVAPIPPGTCPAGCSCEKTQWNYEVTCDTPGTFKSFQKLTDALPSDVTHLYVEDQAIKTLALAAPGLTKFPNLKGLRVVSCGVEVLDDDVFSGAPKLSFITLPFNSINSVNGRTFRNLKTLKQLDLQSNQLTEIPENIFLDCTSLEKLDLDANKITSSGIYQGSFSGLYQLKELFLQENPIGPTVALLLSDSSSLTQIYLNNNELVEFTENTITPSLTLEQIHISRNNLRYVSMNALQGFPVLTYLELGGNIIRDLHPDVFKGRPYMQHLFLSDNPLGNISNALLSHTPSLQALGMGSIHLTSLDPDMLNNLPELRELQLYNNNIQTIPRGVFSSLGNLKTLSLQGNKIDSLDEDVFAELGNLENLNLDDNKLNNITESSSYFQPLTALTVLRVGSNAITTVPDGWLHSLPNLQELHMIWNTMSSFGRNAFPQASKLKVLNIEHNELIELALDSQFPDMIKLDVGHNEIALLDADVFQFMPKLEIVYFDFNQLTEIPTTLFRGNKKLKEVRLDENNIRYLDPVAFVDLSSLEVLNLAENPLCLTDEQADALSEITDAFERAEDCPETTIPPKPNTTVATGTRSNQELLDELEKRDQLVLILIIIAAVFGALFFVFLITTVILCCRRSDKFESSLNTVTPTAPPNSYFA